MLERATQCLNQRGRQSCSSATKSLHTRRQLHSAFWRHGAGDLVDLPTWSWATVKALFEPDTTTNHDDTRKSPDASPAPFLLDFLYSRKTRVYLRRISGAYGTSSHHHRPYSSSESRATTRSFSASSQVHGSKDKSAAITSGEAASAAKLSSKSAIGTQESTDSFKELTRYLDKSKRGEYLDVWSRACQLYTELPSHERSLTITADLIQFLATSPRKADIEKILIVFDQLSSQEKTPLIIHHTIEAQIKLNKLGSAFSLGFQALSQFSMQNTQSIFDALLKHAVARRLWQVAFQVWETRHEASVISFSALRVQADLFTRISKAETTVRNIRALLTCIETFPDFASANTEKDFVAQLIRCIYERGASLGPRYDYQALRWMQRVGYLTEYIFNKALLALLGSGRPTHNQVRYALKAYQSLDLSKFKPSYEVFRKLAVDAVVVDDPEAVSTLIPDWFNSYKVRSLRDSALIMKYFAHRGDVDRVEQAFRDCISHFKVRVSRHDDVMKLFYPLLHVRAIRADPEAVRAQLARLKSEHSVHGFKLDISCINALVHAYQRSDDLDGCLQCWKDITDNDLVADHYTYGTMMSAAADRGDMDLVDQLSRTAVDDGIEPTQVMHDSIVLALLNNGHLRRAETYARRITEENGPRSATRMWNQILTFHALQPGKRELKATTVLAKQMSRMGVPFDSSTFSAIIRSYAVKRKTQLGRRIVRRVMIPRRIPVNAFHYALLIDGFANQGLFQIGLNTHAEMLQLGIKPNFSSRLALQKLQTLASFSRLKRYYTNRDSVRFTLTEEGLQEAFRSDSDLLASKLPRLSEEQFKLSEAEPDAFVDLLLSLYGKTKAFDVVKMLLERYFAHLSKASTQEPRRTPLRILVSAMRLSYVERSSTDVAKFWELAKSTAARLTSIVKRLSAESGTVDEAPYRPPSSRYILARHLDIYMRYLAGNNQLPAMTPTIADLYARGFDFDNRNWNLYVELLATAGQHLDAFKVAESNLIPSFTGWRADAKAALIQNTGQRSDGLEYQAPRQTFLKPGQLRIAFKTVARLALVVKHLRQKAPFERAAADTLAELRSKAPKTYAAVLDMPLAPHPAVTHLLGKTGRVKGERRRLGTVDG